MKGDRSPSRLRDLLGDVGARLGLQNAVATGGLWSNWSDIVGAQISDHAQPTSLRSGVLRVRVSSSTWATEISYFAPEIIRRANEAAGAQLVREVKIWTGPSRGNEDEVEDAEHRPHHVGGAVPDPLLPPRDAPEKTSDRDPQEALEAARRAWTKRRFPSRRKSR